MSVITTLMFYRGLSKCIPLLSICLNREFPIEDGVLVSQPLTVFMFYMMSKWIMGFTFIHTTTPVYPETGFKVGKKIDLLPGAHVIERRRVEGVEIYASHTPTTLFPLLDSQIVPHT